MDNLFTTLKIKGLPKINEKEYAQIKYDQALKMMLKSPTKENIQTFEEANKRLFEVQDAYRIATRLLIAFHAARTAFVRRNYTSYNETKHIQLRR